MTTEVLLTMLSRMMLFLGGRRPALGITGNRNFITARTEGDNRLTLNAGQVVRAMRASKLEIKPKSGFAIGTSSDITATTAARSHSSRVLHEPEDDNKALVAVRR